MLKKRSSLLWPLMALLILLTVVFCLAAYLSELNPEQSPDMSTGNSVLGSLLGSSRSVLSQNLYEKADDYFHFGAAHTRDEAMENDPFKRLKEMLNPHVHAHADNRNVTEIMPWLDFATEMDPHNVEAYLVAAYWLIHGAKEPRIALQVLKKAALDNPNDYRILCERGKIYLMEHQQTNALNSLTAALRVWPSGLDPEDKQMKLDLSQILTYRAFIFELEGDAAGALQQYEQVAVLFPEKEAVQKRIAALKAGKIDQAQIQDMWNTLFTIKHDDDNDHDHEGHGTISDRD